MSELTQNSQKQPDKRRLHHKPYRLTLAIAFLLLVLLAVTAVCIILFETRIRGLTAAAPEPGTYTHHYAFIGDKTNSFDEKVFEAAQEEGKSTGNYVEFLGSTLDVSYSKIDLMKIAIAARVDGIIVSADDTEEMTEQIYNADQAGIPVVCVGADCIGSARKAYVGISYYTLGQTYGALLEKNASASDTASVLVLMSPNEQSKSQNIIYSGIRDYLDSAGLLQRLDLKTMAVGNGTMFSAEESISDLFAGDSLPDILVCLDETDTTAACQAIVDNNRVGAVSIFGYYSNSTILDAIDRQVIPATLTIDTAQIGADSTDCLNEYFASGFVNEFVSIDVQTIDSTDVAQYLEEADTAASGASAGEGGTP